MSEPVRVGIIGARLSPEGPLRDSWGARAHLPALAALPEFEVTAVCTRHIDNALETSRRFNIPRAFDDPEAMVACPDVDLVDVCVSVTAHQRLVNLALESGKDVFCEWPLGIDLAEATELSRKAEVAQVRHMVGLQARSAPVYQYMRRLVADGYVGRVLSCSMNGSTGVASLPGTGFPRRLIHGGHLLDTLFAVVGEDIQQWSAVVSDDLVASHTLVHGRLGNGALVDVNIRHVPVFATGFLFEVDGTDGVLVAAVDGDDLSARGICSLGEQLNQATLRGARMGDSPISLTVPAEHRWVPDDVPDGPALSVAQTFRRFAQSISHGASVDVDFGLAVRRHELIAALEHAPEQR